ncbi:MAG: MBL fold metallo-hydrolase [Clostridia bacterium]|nr:MBL fold metallo-hydrolase [Clostridia bacterium]
MSAKKKKKTKSLPPLLALILALLVFGYYFVSDYMAEKKARESWNTDGSLVMQVIDVGQGDSILLGCDGEYMLVDCGEEEYADTVLEAVRGLDLKYMLASHPHTDHMGGMSEVIRKHPPETFLMPEREHTTREFKAMLEAIEDKQVNAEFVYAGDEFELGSAYVTVVWPEIGFSDSNLNNWSAVLLVEYQGVSILLTGDSEKKVEDDYLKYIPGEIDILKVAHHGSDTSSGAKLLEAIDPDYAVLSLGAGNDYNHPHKEPMERLQNCGAEIYRTDRSGTITFTVKEGEISVATER